MFLTKRKTGIYYIVYTQANGKRTGKSTGCKRKTDAYIQLARFKAELDGHPLPEELPDLNLQKYLYHFAKYSEAIHAYSTTRDYALTYKKLIEFAGNIKLSELTPMIMQNYILHRISSSSLHQGRKDLINLKASLNKAVTDGFLKENPCKDIKRIKVPEKLPSFYSKEDFQKLIDTIDIEDIKDIAIFAVNTGLRQGELINLRWINLDIKNKLLFLDNASFITKSRRVRSIPLNANAIRIIEKRNHLTPYIFTIRGAKVRPDFLIHRFKKYIRSANLDDRLKFHSLRHTFASWLVQKGIPLYNVSKLLGHADIKTTQIYAHLCVDDLRESVERLESPDD